MAHAKENKRNVEPLAKEKRILSNLVCYSSVSHPHPRNHLEPLVSESPKRKKNHTCSQSTQRQWVTQTLKMTWNHEASPKPSTSVSHPNPQNHLEPLVSESPKSNLASLYKRVSWRTNPYTIITLKITNVTQNLPWLNFLPSNRPLPLLTQTGENICSRLFFY